eukprot:COSAG01_NODE_53591_length_338_cov_0.648536_1_plen_55_part_01
MLTAPQLGTHHLSSRTSGVTEASFSFAFLPTTPGLLLPGLAPAVPERAGKCGAWR